MDNTNIFFHAPKELTTDAFWIWILYFLDSEEKYEKNKQQLFDCLILKDEDKGRKVINISVDRQKSSSHGRIDFMFNFTFKDDNTINTVLFEDKTWSSTSLNQLNGYKEDYPNLYRYCYCKLGYANVSERQLVKNCGYDIITAQMMTDCLSLFKDIHILIKYYYDYIKETFSDYISSFKSRLFENKDFNILCDAQAQLYLADKVWETFSESLKMESYILNGTSSGRPWTEIYIIEDFPIIPQYDETIFWRIDNRSGKFYIRLNQYCRYEDDENRTIWNKKQERLKELRRICDDIIRNCQIKLIKGKPTDRGNFEQEIIIFFLDDNPWDIIFNDIPFFTEQFLDIYPSTIK